MIKITGKQCQKARSLLKWNIHDFASNLSSILPRRIESFERGVVQLLAWENDEMVKVFKQAGIVFRADLEVALKTDEADSPQEGASKQGDGARIVLDADQNILSDSSANAVLPGMTARDKKREEEEKAKGGDA